MSLRYINGSGNARITVYNIATTALVETIDFDLCNLSEGQVENYQEDFKRNETHSGRLIDFNFKGSRIIWDLDYTEDIELENAIKIEKVYRYNSEPETFKLMFTPRIDVLRRSFEVRLTTGAYSQGIQTGGLSARGNRLTSLSFITTYPVSKNFTNPNDVAVPLPFYVNT